MKNLKVQFITVLVAVATLASFVVPTTYSAVKADEINQTFEGEREKVSRDIKRTSKKKIQSLKQLVKEQRKIMKYKNHVVTFDFEAQKELLNNTSEEVLQAATEEVFDSINKENFQENGSFIKTTSSGLQYIYTSDDVLEEPGNEFQSIEKEIDRPAPRSISVDQAVKKNVKKEFGYRRYDATLSLAWCRVVFHTHYYVGSNGLTLANFKDNKRVGMSCDIELMTSPMSFGGEMGKGYEDGRAEKVGYDINAVGKWKIGIDATVYGIKLQAYVQHYVVSFVKLIEQGSNYVKVNQSLRIYTKLSEFNF